MSFIITIITQEGIVMASDSRLTISLTRNVNGTDVVDTGISQSDTSYKTFSLDSNALFGISMFGASTLQGVPLSGYIESFITHLPENTTVEQIPALLVSYFNSLPEKIDTGFHVAGYQMINGVKTAYVSRVYSLTGEIVNVIPAQFVRGAIWDGETDVMTRILNSNLYLLDGDKYVPLAYYGVPFDLFTLQDAINFAFYAVKVTSDTMGFQLQYKTVGGAVDVLVIKPNKTEWIARKSLHIPLS